MGTDDWRLDYSARATLHRRLIGGYQFDFPLFPGHVNMLTAAASWAGIPRTVSMTFKIKSRDAVYGAIASDQTPAALRFYLQRKNDDFSGQGEFEFYRWWSNPVSYRLGSKDNQRIILMASVNPGQWSSVYGKLGANRPDMFNAAWRDTDRVGVTFGGQFFGHGVYLNSGRSRFILMDFGVHGG